MNSARILFCVVLSCLGTPAGAAEFTGKVIAVLDGDTVLVTHDGKPVKARLAEIDAPEKAQPYGADSQKSLADMVKGKQIKVVSSTVDDYGRLISRVYIGEFNVNHEQVRRGMAWEYSRYHSNRELVALQREAQEAKRGLWAEDDAIEPSQWRKQHPVSAAEQPNTPASPSAAPVSPPLQADSGQVCGKKHCPEISSCEEASVQLSLCGQKSLDGDADGKPCEKLCAPAKGKAVSNR
jgi:endonuclease YncB( thermonuclease family)